MPSYRLTSAAADDLADILDFGIRTFGLRQTAKYHAQLEARFDLLVQFPHIGNSASELADGLHRFGSGSHMIFYTLDADGILICRVLHAAADFGRHF